MISQMTQKSSTQALGHRLKIERELSRVYNSISVCGFLAFIKQGLKVIVQVFKAIELTIVTSH